MKHAVHNVIDSLTERVTNILFIGAMVISALIYLLHIVTHFPFFDGTIHARYLWLISSGYIPNLDFFCLYPTLGYFLTLPYFDLFPESAFVLLALRLFSAMIISVIGIIYFLHGRKISNHWVVALLPFLLVSTDRSIGVFFSEYSLDHIAAMTALWAMTLIMSEPGFGKLVLCSALSVTSLFIMPKYHFPLFFGLLGFLWFYYLRSRKISSALLGIFTGSISAFLVIAAIFRLNGGSLANNFKYAYLFNYRLSSVMDEKIPDSPLFSPIYMHLLTFLQHHPILSVMYALGISAWLGYAVKMRQKPDCHVFGGGGILLGCLVATLSTTIYTEQYITPTLLCLALFVPFIFSEVISSKTTIRYARFILVAVVFVKLAVRLDNVADEFLLTPFDARGNTAIEKELLGEVRLAPTGINILNEYDDLLEIIPEDETVVAPWPYHPLFRRDLTFQIFDDLPSLSLGLSKNDPLLRTFSPETFKNALERNPPALIVLQGMDEFFPPGWDKIASAFITERKDLYSLYSTKLFSGYVRKDLLPPPTDGGKP